MTVAAEVRSVIHCHCGECRRLSGGAFTTWVSMPRKTMSVFGEESLSPFSVTANVTRHFCTICGTHVFSTDLRVPKIAGVPAGIIEGAFPLLPSAHYFVDDKAAWYTITDALPQFGGEWDAESTVA